MIQPKCQQGILDNKMWFMHMIEYYSAVKRNEIQIHATAWMNPQNIMIIERIQTPKSHFVGFHLYEIPRIGKSIEAESRLLVARGWEDRGMVNDCIMRMRLWQVFDKNVLELNRGAQHGEFIK